jgi:hypothetical protein
MTTKRRLILIAAVSLSIALTFGVLAMQPPGPGVTKANFDRIQEGMTLVEVKKILGEKGRYWEMRSTPISFVPKTDNGVWSWSADDGSWALITYSDGVVGKYWTDSTETILDKIRRWLHLP